MCIFANTPCRYGSPSADVRISVLEILEGVAVGDVEFASLHRTCFDYTTTYAPRRFSVDMLDESGALKQEPLL
ncbi:hypothetical protein J1614_009290 [Plenodomus biglobosus]|nr:hypothetical protein J1614_009290 [Plenodomus biglobosus]